MLRRLMNVVKRRNRNAHQNQIGFSAPLLPAHSIYAIGDIHGCADMMDRLLARVFDDINERDADNVHLIFLGDYVDRGDQSLQVIERLKNIPETVNVPTTCLMGNHEKMMLDFLDAPDARGAMWLRNGGLQTLASYHIGAVSEHANAEQLTIARDALRAALPVGAENWLRGLPLYWNSGNIVCVHAGMDPNRAIDAQDTRNCIWGHRDFLRKPRQDGNWVVHGHTIVEQAKACDGRISIDTGAYASGRLSAAVIETQNVRFLST